MTETIENKIILDLCGGTGAWSKPYSSAGYDVRLITLPYNNVLTYEPPTNVHGILAAPPCTEFSLAKGNIPRDFTSALKIINACRRIIEICMLKRTLKFWCLENPRGFLRQFIGLPYATIHYWEYGDNIDKPTDLWGYFNLPDKLYTEPPLLLKPIKNMPDDNGKTRSLTPPGFAQAFFRANP